MRMVDSRSKEDRKKIRIGRILLAFSLALVLGLSGGVRATEETVQNVDFRIQGQKILVSYDLAGEGTYEVTLNLYRDGGRTLAERPRSVSGDIGKDIRPGKGKRIVWDVLKDMESLEGEGFVFEVRAVRPAGTRKWVWVGGAAAVAAGVAGVTKPWEKKKGTIVIDVPDPEEGP